MDQNSATSRSIQQRHHANRRKRLLTTGTGVMAFAGHCDAHPTENYSVVMADIVAAAGDPTAYTSGVMQRGGIWGYADANINATIARDYAMCFGVGGQSCSQVVEMTPTLAETRFNQCNAAWLTSVSALMTTQWL